MKPLKSILSLTFLVVFCSAYLKAEKFYETNLISDDLKENAHTVIRKWNQEIKVNSINSYEVSNEVVFTILDKNGLRNSFFIEHIDKFVSLHNFKATTYDENGKKIKSYSNYDLKDYSNIDGFTFYSDNRVKYLDPKNQSFPFTIKFNWDLKVDQTFWMPEFAFAQPNVSIENAIYKFSVPKDLKFKFKSFELDDPTIQNVNLTEYTWEIKNFKARKKEELTPADSYDFPYLKIALDTFSVASYPGSNKTWKDLGIWASSLMKEKQILTEGTLKVIDSISTKYTSKMDRAKAIYEYMQKKTRYVSIQVGIGGWSPTPAEITDKLGYGDCKALSNYTMSMLKAAGVESYYCLAHAGSDAPVVDSAFVSNQFNHVIVCIPGEQDTTWLECTSQRMPFGFLGDFTDNRFVLLVNDENSKLIKTRSYKGSENAILQKADVVFESLETAQAKSVTSYIGLPYSETLGVYYADEKSKLKYITESIDLKSFSLKEFNLTNKEELIPVMEKNLKLTLKNWIVNQSGNYFFMPVNFMFEMPEVPERIRNRKEKLFLRRAGKFQTEVSYTLPEKMDFGNKQEDIHLETAFGTYTETFTYKGNQLIVYRNLETFSGKFNNKQYEEYRQFLQDVTDADKTMVELKQI